MAKSLISAAVKLGYIDRAQKEKIQKYREETGQSEDNALRDTKIISEENILRLYSDVYRIPIGKIKDIKDTSLLQRLNSKELYRLSFIPEKSNDDILIYTAQPSNLLYAEDLIKETFELKGSFIHKLVSQKELNSFIAKLFEGSGAEALENFDIEGESVSTGGIYDIAENDSSAVVNLINKIFRDAIEKKVSDIHFEPQPDELVVRFREDGTLYEYMKLPLNISKMLENRIKTMSSLDVNISKTIQDGNCRLEIFGKTVDLRVSVIPSVNGENIVVRVLDQNKMALDISMLGFSEENEKKFKNLIKRPQGLILLTGPTGSGKSTSLYAAVSELNKKDRCIITFEDPVEYRVPGIVQVQINHAMNVTFPQALKSGLRQDIEIALVGEIRDAETASIAFDAANTGHMVFSTLHTNSAASSISSIINECNIELTQKLEDIENGQEYDSIELSGEPADWRLVLSLFSVKIAGREDNAAEDAVIIDERKKQKLKKVFWDMHRIASDTETTDDGKRILHITISTKTKEEMIEGYAFTRKQKEALETLLENADGFIGAAQSLAISDETAQQVLERLPENLPEGRKRVVKNACSLVGKVNYFWGGKSSAIGWDSGWGKMKRVTAPGSRSTGTIRPFGLDCSGFVTWSFINSGYMAAQIGHGAGRRQQKKALAFHGLRQLRVIWRSTAIIRISALSQAGIRMAM